MKDKILSFNEVDNINRNLRMIEGSLGHEVPRKYLATTDLSKKILSFNEVETIACNIRLLEGSADTRPRNFMYYIMNGFYWFIALLFLLYTINYIITY